MLQQALAGLGGSRFGVLDRQVVVLRLRSAASCERHGERGELGN